MAETEDGSLWDFLSLGLTNNAAGVALGSSSTSGAEGAGQAPTPPPLSVLPPTAAHFGGFQSPTAGFTGHHPRPATYAGHHPAPNPFAGFDLSASSSAHGEGHDFDVSMRADDNLRDAGIEFGENQCPWPPQAATGGSSQQYPPSSSTWSSCARRVLLQI